MIRRGNKKERMIRVLLNAPEGTLSKYRIAKLAECSFAWTHEYLKELESHDVIEDTLVKNYEGLFKIWLDIKGKPRKREYLIKKPLETLEEVALEYALTTYQAENLVQNYLFPSRIDLYIKESDEPLWNAKLSLEGLLGRGNVRILVYDEHVFYHSFMKKHYWVVSLPQLIVDLYDEGGVCAEAADHLFKKIVSSNV